MAAEPRVKLDNGGSLFDLLEQVAKVVAHRAARAQGLIVERVGRPVEVQVGPGRAEREWTWIASHEARRWVAPLSRVRVRA